MPWFKGHVTCAYAWGHLIGPRPIFFADFSGLNWHANFKTMSLITEVPGVSGC